MSQAFSTGYSPLGTDLRNAVIADADDVARLLSEMGYPCDIDDAAERIDAQPRIVGKRRQDLDDCAEKKGTGKRCPSSRVTHGHAAQNEIDRPKPGPCWARS